ncbi:MULTISPECIES: HAD-IC family P-type ATPase [unclassified Thiocapsa]|uniref:HAD-IC family P-type ATPase n=1 Tax=unclassified Thiocapsa TaxID=2641286 RepID=UPI0035B1D94B
MTAKTQTRPWHCLGVVETTKALEADPARGLSTAEADLRRHRHGENALAETKSRPLWLRFLDQFRNLLVIVLLCAAVLAWTIGDLKDAVAILIVVILNAALGFYQEHRAERTLSTLKAMVAVRARVRRDGRIGEVEATDLMPGDLVLLEAGDRVPADGRLLTAPNLEVDEAALTGESQPAGKSTQALDAAGPPLAERLNMLWRSACGGWPKTGRSSTRSSRRSKPWARPP